MGSTSFLGFSYPNLLLVFLNLLFLGTCIIFLSQVLGLSLGLFSLGNGQKRELPMLFDQKRMYPENNSGRECCWPYLIGQHLLSPVFGQKRPGTPGNSYFAQLPPVFGHFLFRFWPFYVPLRWATRLLEQINMGQNVAQVTWRLTKFSHFSVNNFGSSQ